MGLIQLLIPFASVPRIVICLLALTWIYSRFITITVIVLNIYPGFFMLNNKFS